MHAESKSKIHSRRGERQWKKERNLLASCCLCLYCSRKWSSIVSWGAKTKEKLFTG